MLKILQSSCLVILCFATSFAQPQNYAEWENGVTERWWVDLSKFSRQELDTAIERWKLIEMDNKNVRPHEWAGGYFTGSDTHGTYMRWSQQTGFVMAQVNKCAAQLMGLSYGRVTISPTSVDFIFEHHKSSGSHGHTKSHIATPTTIRFVPIKWSYDQYLVQENEMAEFGDFVAGLGKYNQEFVWVDGLEFFARSTSEAKSNYEDLPQVPFSYKHFIKKPIDAEITVVGVPRQKRVRSYDDSWQYESHTRVSLNVGAAHGVKRGMYFRVLSSDQGESVKVIRVGQYSSEGIIVRWLDEDKQEYARYPKIQVGWQLSTSVHKYISSAGS